MDKKVIVLLGGISNEADISLVTGEAIYKSLKENNINVEKFYLSDDIEYFVSYIQKQDKENLVVFNALHGQYGEDGRIQSVLDLLKVPYTHSGTLTSAMAMDKSVSKKIAIQCNVPVAKEIIIKDGKIDLSKAFYPSVIKPTAEGSSVGIYFIENENDLKEALEKLKAFSNLMLEEYIEGTECTVGVLKEKPLAVTEIIPKNKFYDYASKYDQGGSEHIIPARISEKATQDAMSFAGIIYKELGCTGAARVDFIIKNDTPYFLEVNTQPGMTPVSLLPEQADYNGVSFFDLCIELIKEAKFN